MNKSLRQALKKAPESDSSNTIHSQPEPPPPESLESTTA